MRKLVVSASVRRTWRAGAFWLVLALMAASAPGSLAQGYLWGWGYNGQGELGDGTTTNRSAATRTLGASGVGLLAGVTQVATGENFAEMPLETLHEYTLALRKDGTVWAWGDNAVGELGNDTNMNATSPTEVVTTDGTGMLTGITQVAASAGASYALASDGTIWAWGDNSQGELGNGGFDSNVHPTPTHVLGVGGAGTLLTGVQTIAVGDYYALALKTDGTVYAWGSNFEGQLGSGGAGYSPIPIEVSGPNGVGYLTRVQSLAVGADYVLALTTDGTVWAWGENTCGQLGNNTFSGSSTPVQVKDATGMSYLTGVTAIAANPCGLSSYAMGTGGIVWAWGDNSTCELGDSALMATSSDLPVPVGGSMPISGVSSLAFGANPDDGFYYVLALKSDGTVWAWGDNTFGELGDGNMMTSDTPTQVVDSTDTTVLTNIFSVATNYSTSYAIKNDGTVWAWGENHFNELGDGGSVDSDTPVQVNPLYRAVSVLPGVEYAVARTGYQLIFQNIITGDVYQWLMSGASRLAGGDIGTPSPSTFRVVATADFTGSSFNDVLFQDSNTQEIGYWSMNGAAVTGYTQLAPPGAVASVWKVMGAANLTGAGLDILLENTGNGEVGYWTLMDGVITNYTRLLAAGNLAAGWKIAGTPHFTGGSGSQILWENTQTGELGYWTLSGSSFTYTQIEPPGAVLLTWRVVATPDVEGTGTSDIVWQNLQTGEIGYSTISAGQVVRYTQIEPPYANLLSFNYRIIGTL